MIAFLKSRIGMILAGAGVGFVLGMLPMYLLMDARLEAEQARRKAAEQETATARGDLKMCEGSVARQNAAIEELQRRAGEQRGEYLSAEQARVEAEAEVARILRMRTPAGVSRCEAARNMIAEELRRERAR